MAGRGDIAAVAQAAGGAGPGQLGRSGDSAVARRATGAIETHAWRDGRTVTVRARLRAYGRRYRIDFGTNHEGWSVERARVQLDRILQQERGTWEPPSRSPEATTELEGDEMVHVTASRWWQRRKAELAPNTRLDYKWRLDYVLRYLARATTALSRLDLHEGGLQLGLKTEAGIDRHLELSAFVIDELRGDVEDRSPIPSDGKPDATSSEMP
jgi:hypothetical protein